MQYQWAASGWARPVGGRAGVQGFRLRAQLVAEGGQRVASQQSLGLANSRSCHCPKPQSCGVRGEPEDERSFSIRFPLKVVAVREAPTHQASSSYRVVFEIRTQDRGC